MRLALVALLALGCATHPRAPRLAGALRFQCAPRDAHLIYDEEDLGPCLLWSERWLGLTPGPHRLRVERSGYFAQESEPLGDGRRRLVRVNLRAIPE